MSMWWHYARQKLEAVRLQLMKSTIFPFFITFIFFILLLFFVIVVVEDFLDPIDCLTFGLNIYLKCEFFRFALDP